MKKSLIYSCILLFVTLTAGAVDKSWTGVAGDSLFSSAANWEPAGGVASGDTLLFTNNTALSVINDLGGYSFSNITMSGSAPVTFEASGNAFTLNGNVTVLTPVGETPITHTIDVPLVLSFAHDFQIGSAQTLAISAPISGGTPTDPFIKIGDGTLNLTGTNTFESPLVISNGFVKVNNGTALGNPTNTITLHRPTSTDSSFNKIGPLYFTDTVVTNERPIIVGSAVSYIGQMFPGSAKLVLNGKFTFTAGARVDCQGTLVFRGGFESINAKPWMQTASGFITRFEEQPLNVGSKSISIDNYGTFNVCTTNNTWNDIGLFKGTFLCGAPHVIPTNSYITFGVGYAMHGFLDLNGFDQQVKYLRYTTAGGSTNIFVNSAQPATLTLQGDSSDRPFVGYFAGKTSLRHRNSGTLAFISPGSASTTVGDLLIEAGAVAFRNGATWTGSTNITVTAGTLSVEGGDGNTFGGSDPEINLTSLNLTSSSVVNLEAGVTEYVNTAILAGVHLPIGTYGSADSSAQFKSVLFAGTGILHVMCTYDEGTLIMLR